jgi:hypothetical protein
MSSEAMRSDVQTLPSQCTLAAGVDLADSRVNMLDDHDLIGAFLVEMEGDC